MTTAQDERYWDERYGENHSVWSGEPNPQLVSETSGLVPGTALEVGSGEGADAIWLARRGWNVTAVDFSAVALARAADRIADEQETAKRITWAHHDVTQWTPPAATFDLVTTHYMQLPRAQREALFRRLAAAVAPGGTLLIVGHDLSDMDTGVHRPPMELFFTADEVAETLDPGEWRIIVSDARPRSHKDADGHEVPVNDAVLRAQRTAPRGRPQ
jgi:SAM-dependent methyltransferase